MFSNQAVHEVYLIVANSCLTSSLEGMTPARAATAVLTDGQAAATMQQQLHISILAESPAVSLSRTICPELLRYICPCNAALWSVRACVVGQHRLPCAGPEQSGPAGQRHIHGHLDRCHNKHVCMDHVSCNGYAGGTIGSVVLRLPGLAGQCREQQSPFEHSHLM